MNESVKRQIVRKKFNFSFAFRRSASRPMRRQNPLHPMGWSNMFPHNRRPQTQSQRTLSSTHRHRINFNFYQLHWSQTQTLLFWVNEQLMIKWSRNDWRIDVSPWVEWALWNFGNVSLCRRATEEWIKWIFGSDCANSPYSTLNSLQLLWYGTCSNSSSSFPERIFEWENWIEDYGYGKLNIHPIHTILIFN